MRIVTIAHLLRCSLSELELGEEMYARIAVNLSLEALSPLWERVWVRGRNDKFTAKMPRIAAVLPLPRPWDILGEGAILRIRCGFAVADPLN